MGVKNTSQLGVWRDNLKRTKNNIRKLLDEAKENGGKDDFLRRRLKDELKIAKSMRKAIKEIEETIQKTFTCPCCGCELKMQGEDEEQCITLVKKPEVNNISVD